MGELLRRGIIAELSDEGGIEHRSSGRGMRTFGFLFYAFACIVGGAFLCLLAPVTVIHCSANRSCTVEHRIAGIYTFNVDHIDDVIGVGEGTRETTHNEFLSSSSNRGSKRFLTIQNRFGSVETDMMSTAVPTHAHIRKNLEAFLADPNRKTFTAWQGEVMLIVPLLLAWAAVHFVRLAFRR